MPGVQAESGGSDEYGVESVGRDLTMKNEQAHYGSTASPGYARHRVMYWGASPLYEFGCLKGVQCTK